MEKGNQKQRGRRRRWKFTSGLLAGLLVVALGVGLVPGGSVYAAELTADGDTKTDYSRSLGSTNSTRYNGRVWADKSVSTTDVTFQGNAGSVTVPIGTGEDASDFLVTYSTLATSAQVSGESSVPVDVVFVVDLSGSMSNGDSYMNNGQKRIQNLVTALNTALNELMDMNPNNRVGVVGYSTTATEILALDHYTAGSGNNIFAYEETVSFLGTSYTLSWNARNSFGRIVSDSKSVTGGTNVQMGIYQGMNMLASEDSTTVTVNGQTMARVPSVIIMSDGAATYSSSSTQWWSPSNDENDGPGNGSYYGNGMKAMMTASYMKQAIDRNYDPVSDEFAATVYTIGIGTSGLNDNNENLANITLNPKDHWNDNNDMANSIRYAWNGTRNTTGYTEKDYRGSYGTPSVSVNRNDSYTLTHPTEYDIVDVGLQYNDAYYDAITSEDINDIFNDIVSSIDISRPRVPTKVSGNDPVHDGYITYTDYIGEYMEVDSVKKLIWAGTEFDNPTRSPESGTDEEGNVTYTFTGEINNPAYGELQNVNQIQITVHTDTAADGTRTQTMTVRIPATAIPLRVNTIELNEDGTVYSNTSNNAYPLRLVYGVSLQDEIDQNTLEGVSEDYITAHTENGKVNFYSNKYSGNQQNSQTVGDAKVEFTPAGDNPFYFVQEDTPIYSDEQGQNPVRNFDENATYYVPVTYYEGNVERTVYVSRAASTMVGYVDGNYTNGYHLNAGAPRLGNIEEFVQAKEFNYTGTALTSFYPTFEGDISNGKFVVYLGNNGKLQLDAPASLIISKTVTADEGLTAPDATFTFTVTAKEKANQTVTTVLRENGQADVTSRVTFNDNGEAEVTLKAGKTIELKGMSGVTYSVEETELPSGFTVSEIKLGDTDVTTERKASGKVETDDVTVAFKNNYSASGTSAALTGTKTISGRDFKTGDAFTFNVKGIYSGDAAGVTAPMPFGVSNGAITINPESGTSSEIDFGTITFTVPGTYTYTISEQDVTSSISGVSKDNTVYTVTYTVTDTNKNGTLSISGPAYAIQDTGEEAKSLTWENTYTPANVTISGDAGSGIQVQKTLTGRNWLESDSFTFKLEAETEGAPMPNPATLTVTAEAETAEGTPVISWFGDITYTKADLDGAMSKTFEYQVSEQGTNSNGLTYDKHVAAVTVTVNDDGNGALTAVVSYDNSNATTDADKAVTTAAAFTNSYSSTGTLVGGTDLKVTKNFTGRTDNAWLDTDTFAFELTPDMSDADTKVAVEAGQIQLAGGDSSMEVTIEGDTANHIEGDTANHTAAFGNITFTAAGTYKFVVKEKMPEGATAENNYTVNGIQYDSSAKTVIVKVEDQNHNGTFTVTVENGSDSLSFTNTYSTGTAGLSGEANLEVTKVIDGRDWKEGDSFTFKLAADMSDTATSNAMDAGQIVLLENASVITISYVEGQDADNYKAAFGDITFKKAGTYQFLVTEDVNPLATNAGVDGGQTVYSEATDEQKAMAGWTYQGVTYDNSPKTIIVDVLDNDSGTLTASVKTTGSSTLTFTNTYAPGGTVVVGGDGEAQIRLSKVLSGKEWTTSDEFTFTIKAHEETLNAPMPVNKRVTLNSEDAALQTDATYAGNYKADFGFGPITYDTEGTYKYVVTETEGQNTGIDYSDNVITVTVDVFDNLQGGLSASVTYSGTGSEAQVFVNEYGTELEYSPENGSGLVIEKTLQDHSIAADQFEFTVTAVGDSSKVLLGEESKVVKTTEAAMSTNTGNAVATIPVFTDLTFTQENDFVSDGPEYTFTVQETKGGFDGYENDETVYTVTISVEDDGSGTLTVTTTVKGGEVDETYTSVSAGQKATAKIPFNNIYSADTGEEGVVNEESVVIEATKTLTGRDMEAEEFKFQVTAVSEEKGTRVVATGKNTSGAEGEAADIRFTPINYTKAGLNQDVRDGYAEYAAVDGKDTYTYDYIVSEITDGLADKGVQISSSNSFYVTVTVTDENNGSLTTEVTYPDGGVAFENVYDAAEAILTISGHKKIDSNGLPNAPELQGGEYSFTLTGEDENGNEAPLPDGSEGSVVVENGWDGTINFGTITYTFEELFGNEQDVEEADVPEVTEPEADPENEVTEPETEPEAEVTEPESDLENEVTESEVLPVENTEETNIDDPESEETVIDNENSNADPEQENTSESKSAETSSDAITMTENADPEDATTKLETSDVDTKEEAVVSPMEINTLKVAAGVSVSGDNTRTFIYTITESGELPGVENDSNKQFKVVVTDDGKGHLSAVAMTLDGGELTPDFFTFTNTYSVDPVTSTPTADGNGLTITKKITGRDLVDKEFKFELVKVGTNEVAASGVNDANGNVELSSITYDKPGTHTYILREASGTLGGVTYDTTTYKVQAAVTDNGDGTMSVTWIYGDNADSMLDAVFNNTYTAASTSVTLGAVKRISGRALTAGEFTFRLTDESEKVVSEVQNDANGAVSFAALTFDKAGTYKYTVSEVKGNAENVTYDGTVYTVTITVQDNNYGQLIATVNNGSGLVFTNTYTEPAQPDNDGGGSSSSGGSSVQVSSARTGDDTNIVLPIAGICASVAVIGICAVVVYRKKKKTE